MAIADSEKARGQHNAPAATLPTQNAFLPSWAFLIPARGLS